MSIQSVGIRAYVGALQNFAREEQNVQSRMPGKDVTPENNFADVLSRSLEKVNNLQSDRSSLITSFASGENQNVHELMIAMQKAGLAMNMTAAVRNKVIEAYRELARMQF
jgi:flagellar hook-basal body complex protein FliE